MQKPSIFATTVSLMGFWLVGLPIAFDVVQPAAEGQEPDKARQLVDELAQKARETKTWRATCHLWLEFGTQKADTDLEMVSERPDKFRATEGAKGNSRPVLVCDGKTMWSVRWREEGGAWRPSHITKTDVLRVRQATGKDPTVQALADIADPFRLCDRSGLKYLGLQTRDGSQYHVFEAPSTTRFPSDGKPAAGRCQLWVRPQDGLLARQVTLDPTGKEVSILTFSNVTRNMPVDPEVFSFRPPADGHIKDATEAAIRRLQEPTAAARGPKAKPGQQRYTDDQIRNTDVDVFFERLAKPEPGFSPHPAMYALTHKARKADEPTREYIVDKAIACLQDLTRPVHQRWLCCYVISGIGDERGVPALIQALLEDEQEVVRSVAACALLRFRIPEVGEAMEEAKKREKSSRVLKWVTKWLQKGGKRYTDEEARELDTETLFARLAEPKPEYHHWAAISALSRKAKAGNADTENGIVDRAIEILQDPTRPINQRWKCCYVLSGVGQEHALPALVKALQEDASEIVRSCAARALGKFGAPEARKALEQAVTQEKSTGVLESINRALRTARR